VNASLAFIKSATTNDYEMVVYRNGTEIKSNKVH